MHKSPSIQTLKPACYQTGRCGAYIWTLLCSGNPRSTYSPQGYTKITIRIWNCPLTAQYKIKCLEKSSRLKIAYNIYSFLKILCCSTKGFKAEAVTVSLYGFVWWKHFGTKLNASFKMKFFTFLQAIPRTWKTAWYRGAHMNSLQTCDHSIGHKRDSVWIFMVIQDITFCHELIALLSCLAAMI